MESKKHRETNYGEEITPKDQFSHDENDSLVPCLLARLGSLPVKHSCIMLYDELWQLEEGEKKPGILAQLAAMLRKRGGLTAKEGIALTAQSYPAAFASAV